MVDCFCLDTSFLINGWGKRYPPAVFPSLWDEIDVLIGHDQIWSCDEVFEELKKQNDDLLAWAKERRRIFRKPTTAVLAQLRIIMKAYPNFAAKGGATNRADSFLIAEAKDSGWILVTDEQPKRTKPKKQTSPPKIPDVCEDIGVPWISPADFMRRTGMVFCRCEDS